MGGTVRCPRSKQKYLSSLTDFGIRWIAGLNGILLIRYGTAATSRRRRTRPRGKPGSVRYAALARSNRLWHTMDRRSERNFDDTVRNRRYQPTKTNPSPG